MTFKTKSLKLAIEIQDLKISILEAFPTLLQLKLFKLLQKKLYAEKVSLEQEYIKILLTSKNYD